MLREEIFIQQNTAEAGGIPLAKAWSKEKAGPGETPAGDPVWWWWPVLAIMVRGSDALPRPRGAASGETHRCDALHWDSMSGQRILRTSPLKSFKCVVQTQVSSHTACFFLIFLILKLTWHPGPELIVSATGNRPFTE